MAYYLELLEFLVGAILNFVFFVMLLGMSRDLSLGELMALFLMLFSLAISPCFHWFYLVFTPTLTQTLQCLETFLFLMMISGFI